MNILVTGASSLIGKHVVERLLQRGDKVTVLQRSSAGIAGVREVLCDLSGESSSSNTKAQLSSAMEGQNAVIHLAAKVGVTGRWAAFEAINVHGVQRLLDAIKDAAVTRLVHVSSPSVAHAGQSLIGAPAGKPAPELVRGHYARSKAMGEQRVLAADSASLRVVCLRPHLVWGPGDTQLVQRIIDRARSGRLMLVGSGQALIDTTYIDNAASAIVAAVDHIEDAAGQSLVISNGQPRTVSEIIYRMLRAAGIDTTLRNVPAKVAIGAGWIIENLWEALDKQQDPPMTRFLAEQLATAHWFDQRATQSLLQWQPSVGIEEGFERLAQSLK